MLGRQLRHWQKAPHAFVLNQHTTTVSVVWRYLDDLASIQLSHRFFPTTVFGCFAQAQQAIAIIQLAIYHTGCYFITNR